MAEKTIIREIFYYKTSAGYEIDFVTQKRGQVTELIQVCAQLDEASTKERETRAALVAMQELKLAHATIITRDEADTFVDQGKTLHIIPFYRWAIETQKI